MLQSYLVHVQKSASTVYPKCFMGRPRYLHFAVVPVGFILSDQHHLLDPGGPKLSSVGGWDSDLWRCLAEIHGNWSIANHRCVIWNLIIWILKKTWMNLDEIWDFDKILDLKKDLVASGRFEPGPIAEVAEGDLSGCPRRLWEGGSWNIGRDQLGRAIQWFKGKFTGNHSFYHKIWWVPVNFTVNQSTERFPTNFQNSQAIEVNPPVSWLQIRVGWMCLRDFRQISCDFNEKGDDEARGWGVPCFYEISLEVCALALFSGCPLTTGKNGPDWCMPRTSEFNLEQFFSVPFRMKSAISQDKWTTAGAVDKPVVICCWWCRTDVCCQARHVWYNHQQLLVSEADFAVLWPVCSVKSCQIGKIYGYEAEWSRFRTRSRWGKAPEWMAILNWNMIQSANKPGRCWWGPHFWTHWRWWRVCWTSLFSGSSQRKPGFGARLSTALTQHFCSKPGGGWWK